MPAPQPTARRPHHPGAKRPGARRPGAPGAAGAPPTGAPGQGGAAAKGGGGTAPPAAPATGAPGAGGAGQKQQGGTPGGLSATPPPAGGTTAAAPAPAGTPATPAAGGSTPATPAAGAPAGTTFQDWLNTQYGANNPFGMSGSYSDPNNPIFKAATQNYQTGLAQQRARFGSTGGGSSAREAMMEGDAAANYGGQIATIGEQARQNDANRALQAYTGGQSADLAANTALGNLGTGLTGVGAGEQNIPNASLIGNLISNFATMFGGGATSSKGGSSMWGSKGG